MAPTICSTGNKRQIRPVQREMHLQARNALAQHLSASTNTSAVPHSSSILKYIAKGTLHSTSSLRVTELPTAVATTGSSSSSAYGSSADTSSCSLDATVATYTPQAQQISDNAVSSSTQQHLDIRHDTPSACNYPLDCDDESMDEEDREVHSTSNSSMAIQNPSQLACCTLKSVLNAPPYSDKQQQQHGIVARVGDNRSKQQDSQTYLDMCEIKNTEGLLAIAIKTIKLVKRNRMLQQRLAQLQLETSEFIQSVLANPENRHFRNKMQANGQELEQQM